MTTHDPEIRNEDIERLIAAETEDALAKFRAGDFEGRVRGKVEAETLPRRTETAIFKAVLRPAWIALAAAVVAGAALVLWPPGKKQGPQMASTIEGFLRQAPDSQEVASPPAERLRAEEDRVSPTATAIVQTLLAGEQDAAHPPTAAPKTKPSGGVKPPRPLGLREIYKILVIDKSVERVLALISS